MTNGTSTVSGTPVSPGKRTFDTPDNQMCAETFDTAMLAVGGILDTVRLVMEGKIDNAFCAVRPPGHHAERSEAMGFCYFNNIAIAAKYLQLEWGIEKVAIVDFDVHHGNGTQHIFETDDSVYLWSPFTSIRPLPFPEPDAFLKRVPEPVPGYTHNNPVLPGQGDDEYRKIFQELT